MERNKIKIDGNISITKVMELIKNGVVPKNVKTHFIFDNGRIIAEEMKNEALTLLLLKEYPIEKWEEYNGMKKFQIPIQELNWIYYFLIDNVYYYASRH